MVVTLPALETEAEASLPCLPVDLNFTHQLPHGYSTLFYLSCCLSHLPFISMNYSNL